MTLPSIVTIQETDIFASASRLLFGATIIAIPIRWRVLLLARPNPPLYGDYTDFLLFAPDIFMLACLVFWGVSLLIRRRRVSTGPAHIWILLLGLTFVGWASLIDSWDTSLTLYHASRLTALLLFFLFFINEIHSSAWFVIPIEIQVLIQSIVAIGQSILQHDLGLQIAGEYRLDPAWDGVSVLESGSSRFLRAYGLSDHPNILGGCLAFGLIILLASFVYDASHKERWKIWLKASLIMTAILALFLTFSRSAWLAFFAGSFLIVGIELRLRNFTAVKRVMVLAGACLLFIIPFILRDLPYFSGRFNAGNSFSENRVERGSITERVMLIDAANRIFVDHALTGVGLGASATAIKLTFPEFPMNYQPPHVTLLAAALETGIFGALLYFLLMIWPLLVFAGRRAIFITQPYVISAAALLLAISIVGLFDYYTWLLVPGRLWQWTAWGLWAAALDHYELA